jgi:hypothetical protein
VNCFLFSAVSITLKSKIRYNGQEYSSANELPAEVRAAYEQAMADGAVKKKIVLNGQEFPSEEAMPPDVRKLCDDVMSVIENNGEVTIPNGGKAEPLLTKRELVVVGLFGAGLAALVVARFVIG